MPMTVDVVVRWKFATHNRQDHFSLSLIVDHTLDLVELILHVNIVANLRSKFSQKL